MLKMTSVLNNFINAFLGSEDHPVDWDWKIEEGVDGNGKSVYVATVNYPGIGWIYTGGMNTVTASRSWADRHNSRTEAERSAKQHIEFWKKVKKENDITWK